MASEVQCSLLNTRIKTEFEEHLEGSFFKRKKLHALNKQEKIFQQNSKFLTNSSTVDEDAYLV